MSITGFFCHKPSRDKRSTPQKKRPIFYPFSYQLFADSAKMWVALKAHASIWCIPLGVIVGSALNGVGTASHHNHVYHDAYHGSRAYHDVVMLIMVAEPHDPGPQLGP